jgi:alanine dehydrogenase
MRILSGRDIAALTDVAGLIAPMAACMRAVSRRDVELPLRSMVRLPGRDMMGMMGGWLGDPPGHGIKILSLFPDNPNHGRSSHAGLMILFDAETGLARACLDAAVLTAIRTAAATAMATNTLARKDATRLAILGCGEQAAVHIEAMRAIRPISAITVWGRDPAKAARFAADHGISQASSVADAVAGADIIVTATPATEPFLLAGMLRPGQHIAAVGASIPTMQEIHADCLRRVRLFTDYLPSLEAQAAEVIVARREGFDPAPVEIGTVLNGAAGRQSDAEITMYRSLGVAAQDLAAAHAILARAEAAGRGAVVDMT